MDTDIREQIINRLKLEGYQLLKEIGQEQVGTNGGLYPWLQSKITRAEAENNTARGMAANILMEAFANEIETHSFDEDRLQERMILGIFRTVYQ